MGRERLMDKVYESAVTAVADIPSGSTIVVGGFGLSGIRSVLITGSIGRFRRCLCRPSTSRARVCSRPHGPRCLGFFQRGNLLSANAAIRQYLVWTIGPGGTLRGPI